MERLSFDTDSNEFDNFNLSQRRARKRVRAIGSNSDSTRIRKQRKNKQVLSTLANGNFMMNRNNHKAIYNKFKDMAIEIDSLHKELDNKKAIKNCTCKDKKKKEYSNFNKEVGSSLLSKQNLAIIGVVAISFILFTPYGQKLLK